MQERQIHGFLFEQFIIEHFNLEKCNNYTSKWDAYYNNVPVSIKYEKANSDIELADFFRQSEINEDFYLLVGFWDGDKSNVVDVKLLYIEHNSWSNMFDTSISKELKTLLAEITNDYSDDQKWKSWCSKIRKQWTSKTENLIRLRFKRDHKRQKRIQCAINNKDFFSKFIPRFEVRIDWDNKIFGSKR